MLNEATAVLSTAPGANGLMATSANYVPLNPVSLLEHAVRCYPDKPAVVHQGLRHSYREFYLRCCALARALRGRGIGRGDTVAILAPNALQCWKRISVS